MALRPWLRAYGVTEEDHFELGDGAWKRCLPAPRLEALNGGPAQLTKAQARKAANLFAELTCCGADGVANSSHVSSRVLSEAHCVTSFAARHLTHARVAYTEEHALVRATQRWFAGLAALVTPTGTSSEQEQQARRVRCCLHAHSALSTLTIQACLSYLEYTLAVSALLSTAGTDAFPEWLLAVHELQFQLACPTDAPGMAKPLFVAWRAATRACSPQQLCAATRCDGWGEHAPSLEQLFHAADHKRKGHVTAEDWMRLVKRWWACSEPWDELNAFSL